MTQVISDPIEQKKAELAQLIAEKEQHELQTKGLQKFKTDVARSSSVEEIARLAKNFVWRAEKVRRILHPETVNPRGRKHNKSTH